MIRWCRQTPHRNCFAISFFWSSLLRITNRCTMQEKTPDEVFEFLAEYNKFVDRRPIVVVPSTYSKVYVNSFVLHTSDTF